MLNHSLWKCLMHLQPAFFIPFVVARGKEKPFCFRCVDYHVFSFTAITALLVIMQMRASRKFNQTTDLILCEKLLGGQEFDRAMLDNKIILFVGLCQTQRGFFRFRVCCGLKTAAEDLMILCSPQRCWMETVVNGKHFHISCKTQQHLFFFCIFIVVAPSEPK